MSDPRSPNAAHPQAANTELTAERRAVTDDIRTEAWKELREKESSEQQLEEKVRKRLQNSTNHFRAGETSSLPNWSVFKGDPLPPDPAAANDVADMTLQSVARGPRRLERGRIYQVDDVILGDKDEKKARPLLIELTENGTLTPYWQWQRDFGKTKFWGFNKDGYHDILRLRSEFKAVMNELVRGYVFGLGERILDLDFPRVAKGEHHGANLEDIDLEDIWDVLLIAEKNGAAVNLVGAAKARMALNPKSQRERELIQKISAKEDELLKRVRPAVMKSEFTLGNKFHNEELGKAVTALNTATQKLTEAKNNNNDDDVEKNMPAVKSALDKVNSEIKAIEDQLTKVHQGGGSDEPGFKDMYATSQNAILQAQQGIQAAENLLKRNGELQQYVSTKNNDEMKKQAKQTQGAFEDVKTNIDQAKDKIALQASAPEVKATAYMDQLTTRMAKLEAAIPAANVPAAVLPNALTKVENALSALEETKANIALELNKALPQDVLEKYTAANSALQTLSNNLQAASTNAPKLEAHINEDAANLAANQARVTNVRDRFTQLVTAVDNLKQLATDKLALAQQNQPRPNP